MTAISVKAEAMEQAASKLGSISDDLTTLRDTIAKANEELCAAWTGEGSSAMANISSLSEWYLENVAAMAAIESVNLTLASDEFTKCDSEVSKSWSESE